MIFVSNMAGKVRRKAGDTHFRKSQKIKKVSGKKVSGTHALRQHAESRESRGHTLGAHWFWGTVYPDKSLVKGNSWSVIVRFLMGTFIDRLATRNCTKSCALANLGTYIGVCPGNFLFLDPILLDFWWVHFLTDSLPGILQNFALWQILEHI